MTLAFLLCLLPLTGCSSPEKSVEEHVSFAMEQLEKPLRDAYKDMKLPGKAEDAVDTAYVTAPDSTTLLGKRMTTTLMTRGGDQSLAFLDNPTKLVSYSTLIENSDADKTYILNVYNALVETYGNGATPEGSEPFDAASLAAMDADETHRVVWENDGAEIELSASPNDGKTGLMLTVSVPYVRTLSEDDSGRNHYFLGVEQLGKTLRDAYTDLQLPGTPEEAVDMVYLNVPDATVIHGETFSVVLSPIDRGEETALLDATVGAVSYIAALEKDDESAACAMSLYSWFRDSNGYGEAAGDDLSFVDANANELLKLADGEACRTAWTFDEYVVELTYTMYADNPTLTFEIRSPEMAE